MLQPSSRCTYAETGTYALPITPVACPPNFGKNHMHIKAVYSVIFAAFACGTVNGQAASEATAQLPTGEASSTGTITPGSISAPGADAQYELNICRLKSVIRFAEAPGLYIDDKKVADISNGTKVVQSVSPTATFTIKTAANPFVYRFRDEVLIKGKPIEHMFIVIKAERNLAQGISVFFGGALAEATRQSIQVGDSKNWTASVVAREEFAAKCTE